MSGTVFPAFLKLEHRPDGSAKSSFLSEIDSTLNSAERRFTEFSGEAQRILDQALATRRNQTGSLDLGVAELQSAAKAQQARAIAAREVANAVAIAAREENDYSQAARLSRAATEALAREEEEAARAAMAHASAAEQVQAVLNRQASATDLVARSTGRGTTANHMMVNSQRAVRVAGIQAGQQLTDIAIQLEMGARASTIFVQQIPQLAFALSGLEGSANKTQDRIGKFATFLSGPWGAAIFAGTAVLGPFIYKLFESGDAAEDAARSQRTLTEVLEDTTSSYEEVKKALDDYNRAQERENEVTLIALENQAKVIGGNLREAISIREKLKAQQELLLSNQGGGVYGAEAQGPALLVNSGLLASNEAELKRLTEAARNTTIEVADLLAEIQSNPEKKIKTGFEVLREQARESIVDVDELTQRLAALNRQEVAALDALRKSSKARGDAAEASLGDMKALVQQLFPGATITSGFRPGDKGDHGRSRAIDFVPAGGMGRYTTEEVEQILRDAGVDIRRNGNGTEQMFGPGRSANKPGDHDDHFHFAWQGGAPDPEKVAAATARAEAAMREFGDRSAESIARINERFDEQPRLIDVAAQATRELDSIISDLADKKPFGFERMIADAEAAKGVIEDALVRPFQDLREESERRVEIERLLVQGREAEADALQTIWQIEDRLGPLTAEREAEVRRIVEARHDELEALERLQDEQARYLDATRSVRSEIEAIFSGRGNLGNFKRIFADLNAKTLTERLFGDALRDLDDLVKGGGQLEGSVDYLSAESERAGNAIADLADAAAAGAQSLASTAHGTPTTFAEAFGPDFWAGAGSTSGDSGAADGEIAGRRLENGVAGMTPERYFDLMSRRVVGPLATELNEIFGVQFFSQLQGTMSGALYGYSSGGAVGGVLGAARGFMFDFGKDIFGEGTGDAIIKGLDGALKGAQTGQFVAGLGKSIGINTSTTGAQIGGAIGSALPIPGGEILGAIQGAIIGGLLKTAKRGSALIGGGADGLGITGYYGNSSARKDAAGGLGDSVIDTVNRIAEQLGAKLNSTVGKVSIGIRDDSYRVDTTGKGITKTKNGAIDFGDDAEAAIAFAIKNLIEDGVITGIRQSTLTLLKAGDDLEVAVNDALAFENVFKRLARHKDPVGAAMDDLDAEFERLQDLFTRAGASTSEWADLEELYWLERDEVIKEATERSLSSLRGLLDELTIGNSALSLRDRKSAALAAYAPLADRVAAGDASAYDGFAEAARALLDIERQMSGSQSGYFDLLNQVTALTRTAIGAGAGPDFANRDSPFGERGAANDNAGIVAGISGTNALLEQNNAYLAAIAQNQGIQIAQGRAAHRAIDFGEVGGGW